MANRIAELRQVRAQRISEARQLLDAATAAAARADGRRAHGLGSGHGR